MSKLSPGKWHERVPREYRANLKFRKSLLDQCRHDRQAQLAVIHACKNDLLFHVNAMVMQFNPLMKGEQSVGPFITWEFQEKMLMMEPPIGKGILWCYEHDRTAVVEKSREMGASWLFLIFQDWLCTYHPHVQSFNISRSADAVDSSSRNSLFSKLRFMHEHYPDWLKGEIVENKFYFDYKRTGSENTGEASTGRAGTGGRAGVVFVDEFSEIKEDVKVRQNTASISDCRFFNGTHLGVGTEFYNLTQSPEIVQIQMHWTRHPRKNTQLYSFDVEKQKVHYWRYDEGADWLVEIPHPLVPFPEDYPYDRTGQPSGGPHPGIRSVWYDRKAAEIGTARQVAMELDINPTGSSSQFYEAMTIRKLISQCRSPVWQGELDFDPDTAKPTQFVPGGDGNLRLWIEPQDVNGKLLKVQPSIYTVALDVSYGVGSTPTCVTIFDIVRGLKVGMYVNAWKDPKAMAPFAIALARVFKNAGDQPALLAWETPGPGHILGDMVVKEYGFKNVFWNIVNSFAGEERESDTPGWFANTKSKMELHSKYHIALKTGEFVNWDEESLRETLNYVHLNGTVEHPKSKKNEDASAEGSNHGDRVVADGLAWLMAKRLGARLEAENPPEVFVHPNSIQGRRLRSAERDREGASRWTRY